MSHVPTISYGDKVVTCTCACGWSLSGSSEMTLRDEHGEHFRRGKLAIFIYEDERGSWAEVPALAGCVTQGSEDSLASLLAAVAEAITGWREAQS